MATYVVFGLVLSQVLIAKAQDAIRPYEPELGFLAVGDVGLAGARQAVVAQGMAEWSVRTQAQFTLNLGDNFYESGVSSKDDPLWETQWSKPFSSSALNHTWYSILGNHDYIKNPKAQVDYHGAEGKDGRWYMPAPYYSFQRTIPQSDITIDFFMLDTSPMNDHPEYDRNAAQYEWLAAGLAASKADWIVVCGHHPVFSAAEHGNTRALINHVLPLLLRHGVALYASGHDHILSYITPMMNSDAPEYLISGSGSKLRPGFSEDIGVLSSCHRAQGWEVSGFAAITITKETMTVRLVETTPDGSRMLRAYVKPNPRPGMRNSNLDASDLLSRCPKLNAESMTRTGVVGTPTANRSGSPIALWIVIVAIVFGITGTVTSAGLYVKLRRAMRALERRMSGGHHQEVQFSTLHIDEPSDGVA